MIRAGILSDTHLTTVTPAFRDLAGRAFADCDVIFHAGDIVAPAVLELFPGKTVHAVAGNMCGASLQASLPRSLLVNLEGFSIGLCHGAGPRHNIEERVWSLFPEADCIIYGHTHEPVCRRYGEVLFVNPGAFQCRGAHAAPASYALMTIAEDGLQAHLKHISSA